MYIEYHIRWYYHFCFKSDKEKVYCLWWSNLYVSLTVIKDVLLARKALFLALPVRGFKWMAFAFADRIKMSGSSSPPRTWLEHSGRGRGDWLQFQHSIFSCLCTLLLLGLESWDLKEDFYHNPPTPPLLQFFFWFIIGFIPLTFLVLEQIVGFLGLHDYMSQFL
jgi:hypothetical protein